MNKKSKIVIFALLSIAALGATVFLLRDSNIAVLDPKGVIAQKERDLIVFTTLLGLLIVVPVFALTFGIAWKYRESNAKAKYTPDWDRNILAETIWWGIPTIIIVVLSVITWNSSHELDPFKHLASDVKPINVQVIALESRWLFIYPEQRIATVNYLQFPEKTPINFHVTADAAMNSFWIPQLGGQIYAMAGMSTQLHLMADEPGIFRGSSANLSGPQFSKMSFVAKSSSESDFRKWVNGVKQSPQQLDMNEYAKLIKSSTNNPVAYYAGGEHKLYDKVIGKYMGPEQEMQGMSMYEMDHHAN
ncbi:MAG: Ubiquinol oxidase subunit [Candidatus Saccharibacteria bacterium]|nr:Ubiquinol oxidase subunit [Candidatus Saccharibacteria bacterium]